MNGLIERDSLTSSDKIVPKHKFYSNCCLVFCILIGNDILILLNVLNVDLGGKFELGMKLNPTDKFLSHFKPKRKHSPGKNINPKERKSPKK